jgi:hypothetical protein
MRGEDFSNLTCDLATWALQRRIRVSRLVLRLPFAELVWRD